MNFVKLYDINIYNGTLNQLLSWILHGSKKGFVVTTNVDHIVKLKKDETFQKAYQKASLVLPDGKPLLWSAWFIGSPLHQRITGVDLFYRLLPLCEKNNKSIYLLGAEDEVRKKALARIADEYPLLTVSGSCSPPLGFEKDEKKNNIIIKAINKAKPDFLFIFLGAPKQEKWIYQHIDELEIQLAFCLGASLDFFAGRFKRAPRWMQDIGCEWFWRMACDHRLIKRYLVDDLLPFLKLTIKEIWTARFS